LSRPAPLTPFSYLVLALVGRDGATAHELVGMQRRGEAYFDYAESQWYAEPKRLADLGLLRGEREEGVTRERTRYHLTDEGREALVRWLPEPPRAPHVASDAIIKVLAADLGSDEDVLAAVRSLRPGLENMLARVAEGKRSASTVPHRERYLLLNHRLAQRVLEAHLAWVDEVEAELGADA
jgi:DNA-binding PadR family transcriptional regulator